MATFITTTDVTARLSDQAFRRLFAKSGGAGIDTDFLALCVAEANSRASMMTAAAFPAGLDAAGGAVDAGLKGLVVDLCCGLAASRHASADPAIGAFAKNRAAAEDMLRALNRDRDFRPVTSAAGRAQPQAALDETTDQAGASTRVYGDLADGQTRSSY